MMALVTLALSAVAIAVTISTFRLQAKTQRYLIITQFHISRRWRALGREDEALRSDATMRKLQRFLPVLSFAGLEWLIKPGRSAFPEETGQHR